MNDIETLRQWALAIGALAVAAAANSTVRASLKGLANRRQWPLLAELAPPIASLLYVFGLRVFAEIAPLSPKLSSWLDAAIYVVAVLVVLRIIRRAATVAVEWTASRSSHSDTLHEGFIPLLRNLITLFVFFTGTIMVLKRFNYDVMSLLTALGVGSLAVGLAAKDTLSNMISGFTLIIDRNLKPGDKVNLAGSVGTVEEIGLRSTRLDTGNGNTLIVPNSDLVNTKILNLSLPSREIICTTTFGIPASIAFNRIKQLSLDILSQIAKAHPDRNRWVNLESLAHGHQTITVGFWLRDLDDQGAALSDFHEKLLSRLESEKIPLCGPPITPIKA